MEYSYINIDSKYRNKIMYPNSGKFTLELFNNIKNVSSIKVKSIEFPTNFFKILKLTSDVNIILLYNNIIYNIPIIKNVYTINELIYMLQDYFKNNNISIEIKLWYDNKISFTSSKYFELSFNDLCPIKLYLGFLNNSYKSLKNNTEYTIYNDTIINSTDLTYIFLKINDYGYIHTFDTINNIINNDINILSKISFNIDKVQYLTNSSIIIDNYIFKMPTSIKKFDIELVDTFGNTLDLHDLDYSLTLELTNVIDKNQY